MEEINSINNNNLHNHQNQLNNHHNLNHNHHQLLNNSNSNNNNNNNNQCNQDQPAQPIVICGPSGSGKSTLLKRLLSENREKLTFTISHTTRQPRLGEKNGQEYYFVSREEFQKMIQMGQFLEYTEFSGNLYGTSFHAVENALRTGKSFILELEIEGVTAISKRKDLKPIFIFIKPPSKTKLMERLSSRGTESKEALEKRLNQADRELQFAESGPVQFNLILINDDIEDTYAKLKKFLLL